MSKEAPGLVVYGGAFDPPHAGHIACAALVRRAFPQAKLKIVPSLMPAVAGGTAKQPSASFNDRLAMCRLAFSDAELDDIEAGLPTPNFTYRTLGALAASEIGVRLGWLLGSDQLNAFAGWRYPQKILDLADLVIVTRPGVEGPLTLPDGLHGNLHWIGSADTAASSQLIRAQLMQGDMPPSGWLSQAVAKYIAEHALYKKDDL